MFTALRGAWRKQAVTLVTALTVALPAGAAVAAPAAAPAAAPGVRSAVVSASVAASSVAPKASACPGKRIVKKAIKSGSRTVAWLNVYHHRASGTKCAVTSHAGPSWGRWADTAVDVWTKNGSSGVGGDYRYRTGPASIGGANDVCVGAKGSIRWGGKMRVVTARMLCG